METDSGAEVNDTRIKEILNIISPLSSLFKRLKLKNFVTVGKIHRETCVDVKLDYDKKNQFISVKNTMNFMTANEECVTVLRLAVDIILKKIYLLLKIGDKSVFDHVQNLVHFVEVLIDYKVFQIVEVMTKFIDSLINELLNPALHFRKIFLYEAVVQIFSFFSNAEIFIVYLINSILSKLVQFTKNVSLNKDKIVNTGIFTRQLVSANILISIVEKLLHKLRRRLIEEETFANYLRETLYYIKDNLIGVRYCECLIFLCHDCLKLL